MKKESDVGRNLKGFFFRVYPVGFVRKQQKFTQVPVDEEDVQIQEI
jgi:hypothetical protein